MENMQYSVLIILPHNKMNSCHGWSLLWLPVKSAGQMSLTVLHPYCALNLYHDLFLSLPMSLSLFQFPFLFPELSADTVSVVVELDFLFCRTW